MESKDSLEEELFQLTYKGYKPIKKLGNGFSSYVFMAEKGSDIKAIKVPKNQESYDMIRQGVKPLLMLKGHPNIVEICCDDYLTHPEGDFPYYLMEYLDGKNLKTKIPERAGGGLPINMGIDIMLGLVSALEHAHSKKIYHSDIRPCNIFILNDGRIKLTDFDIARIASSQTSKIFKEKLREHYTKYNPVFTRFEDPVTPGTQWAAPLDWLAPESKNGIFSEKSDIYQLAKSFHYMITGRMNSGTPSKPGIVEIIGQDFEVLYKILSEGLIDTEADRNITLTQIKNILSSARHSNSLPLFKDYIHKLDEQLDFSLENIVGTNFPSEYYNTDKKRKLQEIEREGKKMLSNSRFLIDEYESIETFVKEKDMSNFKTTKEEINKIIVRMYDRLSRDSTSLLSFINRFSEGVHEDAPEDKLRSYLHNYVCSFKKAPSTIQDLCKKLNFFGEK